MKDSVMTERTITLTIDQIKRISDAGCRYGIEISTDGIHSYSDNDRYDYCIEEIFDIINPLPLHNLANRYTDFHTVQEWFGTPRKAPKF